MCTILQKVILNFNSKNFTYNYDSLVQFMDEEILVSFSSILTIYWNIISLSFYATNNYALTFIPTYSIWQNISSVDLYYNFTLFGLKILRGGLKCIWDGLSLPVPTSMLSLSTLNLDDHPPFLLLTSLSLEGKKETSTQN